MSQLMTEITKNQNKRNVTHQFANLCKLVELGKISSIKKTLAKSNNAKTLLSMVGKLNEIQMEIL